MAKRIIMVAYTNYVTDARPRREAETLIMRGDKVYFYALNETGRPRRESIKGVELFRTSFQRYRGSSNIMYILEYLRFFVSASAFATRLFIYEKIDIIYVHTMPDFMVFIGIIPKMFGAKIILNIHDMMPELYMSKFNIVENSLFIRLLKIQERISCSFAHHIICVHDPHKEVLVSRGIEKNKIIILMNIPDPGIFNIRLKSDTIKGGVVRIVYHGTIASRLGIDIAVEAFSIVKKYIPSARLDIYGDGDAAELVQAKIDELHLHDSVYFSKNYFKVDDIPELINGADIGIIPNRKDLATEYMLPVKMMEYIYLDIPVIAPRLKTIQYYFNDRSIAYYTAGDIKDLAETIIRVCGDSEYRKDLVANAKEVIKRYSWEISKQELFKIIDN